MKYSGTAAQVLEERAARLYNEEARSLFGEAPFETITRTFWAFGPAPRKTLRDGTPDPYSYGS